MKAHAKSQRAHRHAPSAAAAAAGMHLQCSDTLQPARRQSRGSLGVGRHAAWLQAITRN